MELIYKLYIYALKFDKNKDCQLRIFLYGNTALDDVNYLSKNLDKKLKIEIKNNQNIYITKDIKNNYEFYIIQGEINELRNNIIANYLKEHYENENMIEANEKIEKVIEYFMANNNINNYNISYETSKILSLYRQFYDILVICVDGLYLKEAKLAFKFFQGFTKINGQQPFIFFLTKRNYNPDVTELFSYIDNECFDRRNVYAFKFPKNDKEYEIINSHFIRCKNYYHEIESDDIIIPKYTFNILICGPAGSGKSTFINQFFQEKVAKEGEGLSVTHHITSYIHPSYPIKVFDTPGFENNFTANIVQKYIENLQNEKVNTKNHLELVLYISTLKERNFYAYEIDFIKYIIENNIKIIFILNDYGKNNDKEVTRLFDITKESIIKIIHLIPNFDKNIEDEITKNIKLIRLKQRIDYKEIDNDNDINNLMKISKQCYGMDELFKKIYFLYFKDKISIHEIETASNTKEMWKRMEKYEILKKIIEKNNNQINIVFNCIKLILSFSKKDNFISKDRDKNRLELFEEISKVNNLKKSNDLGEIYNAIKNLVDKKENKSSYLDKFYNLLKVFKENLENENMYLNLSNYDEETLYFGSIYLDVFNYDFGYNNEKSKKNLVNYCESLNKANRGFWDLSLGWQSVYSDLNKSDSASKIEWVKKFFIKLPL